MCPELHGELERSHTAPGGGRKKERGKKSLSFLSGKPAIGWHEKRRGEKEGEKGGHVSFLHPMNSNFFWPEKEGER